MVAFTMNSEEKNLKIDKDTFFIYMDFWKWFQEHSDLFFTIVKTGNHIEKVFFQKLADKLMKIKEGIYFLAGMLNEDTVELIFTPDGVVKNVVFVEELVQSAPTIKGWRFTALKQPHDIKDCNVQMKGYTFSHETLSFYSNVLEDYPDEIDVTIVHKDYKEENKEIFSGGACIFLDNYLGELKFIETIDNLSIIGPEQVKKEPVPASKLKDFLNWREKEFLEKYRGARHDTQNDKYATLEGMLQNKRPIIAIVNATLLDWDRKASYPWILKAGIRFKGHYKTGMPDDITHELLNAFEKDISKKLLDYEGYLNIGRQTSDNIREIYYACKDFRKPSRILHQLTSSYKGRVDFTYDIYKDKYWRSFEHLRIGR